VIKNNPQHIFQILTKRSWRAKAYFFGIEIPKNLWFGITVEDKRAVYKIDVFKNIRATVRFISFEPLLEDVGVIDLFDIDWVIVGSETGQKVRPMSIEWARSIMVQCYVLKIPFFFKKVSKGDFMQVDLNVREFPNR
ncbi:MAG: DUF5131 family protein, partial [Actinobacteria bacterium]|nr:DUF5131 family protein [Actinomycetota bacterium]